MAAQAGSDGVVTEAEREYLYGWIDGRAAMRHLGLGSQTALYRLITDHRLPYGRVGNRYRFKRIDLDAWARVVDLTTLKKTA